MKQTLLVGMIVLGIGAAAMFGSSGRELELYAPTIRWHPTDDPSSGPGSPARRAREP